jgi:trehalose 6-phosphate phosphatase
LSAIVDRPEDAVPVPGAIDAMEALTKRFALVAIVSGRSLEDLRMRIKARGVLLAGAYGRDRSDRQLRRQTEGWETVSVAASVAIRGLDGVVLERKGAGIALHYRAAPHHADAVAEIAAVLAREFDLEVRPGRKVFELVVPGPAKGDAVTALIEQHRLSRALVAGDDWGDLDAFGSVRSTGVEAVIVAVSSDEAPPDLESEADLIVDGPPALVALLSELALSSGS